jgi:hypothetical protein
MRAAPEFVDCETHFRNTPSGEQFQGSFKGNDELCNLWKMGWTKI